VGYVSVECNSVLLIARAFREGLKHLVEREAAGFLARREFLERAEELSDVCLCGTNTKKWSMRHSGSLWSCRHAQTDRAQVEELGRRSVTNGSCQTSKPSARCSAKTTFQLS